MKKTVVKHEKQGSGNFCCPGWTYRLPVDRKIFSVEIPEKPKSEHVADSNQHTLKIVNPHQRVHAENTPIVAPGQKQVKSKYKPQLPVGENISESHAAFKINTLPSLFQYV